MCGQQNKRFGYLVLSLSSFADEDFVGQVKHKEQQCMQWLSGLTTCDLKTAKNRYFVAANFFSPALYAGFWGVQVNFYHCSKQHI